MQRVIARLVLALCLGTTIPAALAAQGGAVRGRVADSSGTPVVNATVTLSPGGPRARTNDLGEFYLQRVTPGTYALRGRKIGYDGSGASVTVADGQTLRQDLIMWRLPTTLTAVEVVVGSRARHTAAEELAVPVDVFTVDQIRSQGTTETSQILAQLSPSVNFPRQSVSDASEIVRPFTMRGLSPDHSLVLINGKRRHRTALIHYYGAGQGAGSSGVDMNAIPAGAIDRLEVLRDGAAAQYGSDAIAGVVNLALKDGAFPLFVTADVGQYMSGQENFAALPSGGSRPSFASDGRTIDLNGGWGFGTEREYFALFAEVRDRQETNRAGPDPTDMFTTGDADGVTDGKLTSKNNTIPQPNHHWGDGASRDLMTFVTFQFPMFNDAVALYGFGGHSGREGLGYGYYRAPISERNWREIYPTGFLPGFAPDVLDLSGAGGVRGSLGQSAYDLSASLGHNGFKYDLGNTLNTSLGPCLVIACAPGADDILGTSDDPGIPNKTEIFAGELRLTEMIFSLDVTREMNVASMSLPLNVAYGAALRNERYQILAGELASYVNGFHKTQDSTIAPSGSQVFPGFRPQDVTNETRNNIGAYLDIEGHLRPALLANVAARFERYSDFGNKLTGKLALRAQPSNRLTLRGAVSTGFRAPSLNQTFFSSVVTNFKADPVTGNPVPFELGIFPVASAEARALGAKPLKAESSVNLSLGFATAPAEGLTITADAYQINVNDRIVLTGFLDEPGVVAILQGINSRAEAAQYFTNAIDTRTRGLDLTGDYRVSALAGALGFNAAVNFTSTVIPNENNIPVPPELAGTGEELIGKYDEGGLLAITKERPAWRGTFTTDYRRNAWSGLLRYSYYGKYTSSLYSYSGADAQTYSGKGLTDVELGYTFKGQKLAIGSRNVFDVYPDRMSAANGFDIFPFPPASPFGYNGRYLYTRLELTRP